MPTKSVRVTERRAFVRIPDSKPEIYPQPDEPPVLLRGITGFWSADTEPPPFLDETAFRQMCYALARENSGTITEVDTDTTARNFYSAKLCRYDSSIFLLQNIHSPYAAFARQDAYGAFLLTRQPEWLRLPESPVCFLSLPQLNRHWHGLCGELSPEELEQIRYWQPNTVGEILFNHWD